MITSPSGRYQLKIEELEPVSPEVWGDTRGTIYRVSDGKEVVSISRNYPSFHHSFVTKNGEDFLITGSNYMSSTFINLDTGERIENEGDGFCWAEHILSPDGSTLLVTGCVWGGPYAYKFYDFTDPHDSCHLQVYDQEGNPVWVFADEETTPYFEGDLIICKSTERIWIPTGQDEESMTIEEMEAIGEEELENLDNWRLVEKSRAILRREGDRIVVVETVSFITGKKGEFPLGDTNP